MPSMSAARTVEGFSHHGSSPEARTVPLMNLASISSRFVLGLFADLSVVEEPPVRDLHRRVVANDDPDELAVAADNRPTGHSWNELFSTNEHPCLTKARINRARRWKVDRAKHFFGVERPSLGIP